MYHLSLLMINRHLEYQVITRDVFDQYWGWNAGVYCLKNILWPFKGIMSKPCLYRAGSNYFQKSQMDKKSASRGVDNSFDHSLLQSVNIIILKLKLMIVLPFWRPLSVKWRMTSWERSRRQFKKFKNSSYLL